MTKQAAAFDQQAAKLEDRGAKLQASSFFMERYAKKGVAALNSMLDPAKQVQSGLAEVQTLLPDLDPAGVAKLTKEFKLLAANSPFMITDQLKGLYDTISARGPETAGAFGLLNDATEAAIAGVSRLSTAVDLGTTVMNSWGLAANDSRRVFDVTQTGIRRGKTTFDELAASIGEVSSIAAVAEVPFEQVVSSLAAMTGAGIKTRQATTALRSLITAMSAPTSEAAQALSFYGGEAFDAAVKAGRLDKALASLSRRDLGLAELRQIFPDIEAAKAAAALINNLEGFQDILADVNDSTGEVTRAYEKMASTSRNLDAIARNKLNVGLANLGEKVLPTLDSAIESVLPTMDKFFGFMEQHPDVTKFALATGALSVATLAVAAPLAGIAGSFLIFKAAGLGAMATTISTLATGFGALSVSVIGLSAPIAATAAAALALGNAIRLVHDNWSAFTSDSAIFEFGRWLESLHGLDFSGLFVSPTVADIPDFTNIGPTQPTGFAPSPLVLEFSANVTGTPTRLDAETRDRVVGDAMAELTNALDELGAR